MQPDREREPTAPEGTAGHDITATHSTAADLDREWFEKHPRASIRHRAATYAEMIELWPWLRRTPAGQVMVEVHRLAPGVRCRLPYVVARLEEAS